MQHSGTDATISWHYLVPGWGQLHLASQTLLRLPPKTGLSALAAAKSLQSCPTLCNPIDGSPLGSSVPGSLQARTLEWVAISFSNAWKWKVKVKSFSHARLLATPWTAAHQAPPSMGFSRQEYWSGLPLPSSALGTSVFTGSYHSTGNLPVTQQQAIVWKGTYQVSIQNSCLHKQLCMPCMWETRQIIIPKIRLPSIWEIRYISTMLKVIFHQPFINTTHTQVKDQFVPKLKL